jgi:hypothetical protein
MCVEMFVDTRDMLCLFNLASSEMFSFSVGVNQMLCYFGH